MELELIAAADKLDLKDATFTTAENVVNYFKDVFGVEPNAFDMNVILDLIADAVMFAYKTGADTTEAIVNDPVEAGEIVDAEFTIIEVVQ
jgi:hypothetical protein